MKILNFGSLNIDYTYMVDKFVKGGETIKSFSLKKNIGGKGLNQSVALAKAGTKVYHAGAVGADGEFLVSYLNNNGVDTGNVLKTEGVSGHAIIQVDSSGKNCIIIYGGANIQITNEHIDNVLKNFEKDDMVLLQNEINNIEYIARKSHEKGMLIAFNPSPSDNIDLSFEYVDYLLLNEHEAEALFGESDVDKAIQLILNKYPKMKVILTLGENGSVYADENSVIRQSATSVKVLDTTAAGDTFTGYFLASILKGENAEYALAVASKAAGITCSRNGAAESIPSFEEIR